MKPGVATRLAWAVAAATLLMIVGIVVLTSLNPVGLDDLSFSIVGISSAVVGALVASRRPNNAVGWLFLAGAFTATLRGLSGQYAVYGVVTDPGGLPAPEVAAWLSKTVEFVAPVVIFVLIPLLFPTGRPVSPRWRVVSWLAVGVLPFATLLAAFEPGAAVSDAGIRIPNPLGAEAARRVEDAVGPGLFVLYIALILAAAASLVVRFLRSVGEERQQLKWFTYAAAFIPLWFLTNRPVELAFPLLFQVLDAVVIGAVPIAAGIAILRYRLYDIDLLINRTLVYGLLSAMLLGIYFGSVVLLEYAIRTVSGEESQLAVVGSTLAIAALFNPLRRGTQRFIDRRFYRARYDVRATLEAFASRLRGETDLDALGGDLVSVARKTMRPEHVSLLLLRPDGERGER